MFSQGEWKPHGEALRELGMSRTQFWNLRKAGVVQAVHLYRTGTGKRSPLWVNVEGVRLALRVRTAGLC